MRELPTSMRHNLGLAGGLFLVVTLSALAIFGPRGSEAHHNTSATAHAAQNAETNTQQQQGPGTNAPAGTKTWTGGSTFGNEWTRNGNWDGAVGAGPGDDLVFADNAQRKPNCFNDFAVNTSFNSLSFTGGDYRVTGNQILLISGLTINVPAGLGGNPIFSPNILMGANQTWTTSAGSLTLDGVVGLNSHNLVVNTATGTSIVMNGQTSGTGAITKNGNGTLQINGNAGSFGTTTVNDGALQVGGTVGSVTLNGGTIQGAGAVAAIQSACAGCQGTIAPGNGGNTTGILTVNGITNLNSAATFAVDLNGANFGTQYDRLNDAGGGNVVIGGASLAVSLGFTPSIGQTFTIIQTNGGFSVSGQFAQGTSIVANGQLFTIAYNAVSVVLTAQGSSLTWDGGGADNNWSTAANWNPNVAPLDGIDLVFPAGAPADSLTNNNDIGSIFSKLNVGSLTISGNGYQIGGNAITVSGVITANQPAGTASNISLGIAALAGASLINNGAAALNIGGALTFSGSGVPVDGTNNINLNGQISGSGGFTKNGSGTLTLAGNNSFTGTTTINSGILQVSSTNAMGASGAGNGTLIQNSATLQLNNNVINIPEDIQLNGGGVGGSGVLNSLLCSTGCSLSGAITLAGNSSVVVPIGHTVTLNGAIGGTFALNKLGLGTLVLGGSNSYNGTTSINSGTLLVNSINANSPVSMTGGTLGGTGTVGQITATGGTVAPGASPGILTSFPASANNTTFNAATTFNVEIGGTASGTFDRLTMNSLVVCSLNLGGANLIGSLTGGFNPVAGTQFTIISLSSGSITGQFAQANNVTISGRLFLITYNTNSVVLTATPATVEWDGGGADNNWTTAGNWVGNVAPQTLDTLVFPPGAARLASNNNYPAGTTFASLSFSANGYIISGNDLGVVNGMVLSAPSGSTVLFQPNITLTVSQSYTVGAANTMTLSGNLSGSGSNLTKSGAGTLILSGTNTYTGTTTVNSGTLLVNGNTGTSVVNLTGGTLGGTGNVGGITATGGTVAPGNNLGQLSALTFSWNAATTLNIELGGLTSGTADLMFAGSSGGTSNLGGANLTGSLVNGFNPPAGTQITIVLAVGSTTGQFAQGNNVTLSGRQFTITYNSNSVVLTALAGTFTWDGGGADNNWTTAANWVGDVAPQAGDSLVFPTGAARLTNNNNFAPGTVFGSLSFTGNGYTISGNPIATTLGITENSPAGSVNSLNLNLTLGEFQSFTSNGNGLKYNGTLNLNGFTLTLNGTGTNCQLRGVISGAGGVVKNGTGFVSFHGVNSYTGVTFVNAGDLAVFSASALGATGANNVTVVTPGGSLLLTTQAPNLPEAITISGNGSQNHGALTTNGCEPSCTLAGAITLANNSSIGTSSTNDVITLNGSINEAGGSRTLTTSGNVILAGANTYTGGTTVSAGTLLVNGSTGNVQVDFGTLGGTGTVGSINGITAGSQATVSPGASAGILNANGNVTFGSTIGLKVEINGATLGSQYDQLNVTGSGAVNLGGANLIGSLGNGFNPADGTQFTILQTTGTITGQFAQGSAISFGGKNFHITYNTQSVVLTAFTPNANNLQFSTSSYSAGEGALSATITVTRTGDTSGTSTVDFATSDVGAEQRTDYTIGAGTITFAPGETSKTFDVLLVDDLYVESSESLTLTLSNSTGGAVLGSPSVATLTVLNNDSGSPTTNPLDNADARFFVRQHFYDFLSRQPDPGGFDFWAGQITQCGADQSCANTKRLDVSNAFFFELEYQQTGAYVFRLYRAAFGNNQPFPNPDNSNPAEALKLPSYTVFASDRARVVGGADLASGQLNLANAFVQRPSFLTKYPASLDGPGFVDAVLATIQNDLGADLTAQRTALINLFNSGGRGAVLYRLADDNANNPISNAAFIDAEYNRAFVATQYFGYLRRDPDIGGFLFWLGQVNSAPLRNVAKQHSMVCSFNTSLEYQLRFSSVATHSNGECP